MNEFDEEAFDEEGNPLNSAAAIPEGDVSIDDYTMRREPAVPSGRPSAFEQPNVIMEWIYKSREANPEACVQLANWAHAVIAGGARSVASATYVNDRGQRFFVSIVPGTGAMVVFYERQTVPIRRIVFSEVFDLP